MADAPILALALVGSRVRGFNHDTASKLQRLMMASAELAELTGPAMTPDQRLALESIDSALAELEALFAELRQLAKGSEPAALDLDATLARAARRVGVRLAVELPPDTRVTAPGPELVEALARLFEAIGGPAIAVRGQATGLTIAAGTSDVGVALALVDHVVGRTGGSATRDGATITIRF